MGGIPYGAGLYLRLSKDDERAGVSVSIENQRLLLTKYAEGQGWEIKDIYIEMKTTSLIQFNRSTPFQRIWCPICLTRFMTAADSLNMP